MPKQLTEGEMMVWAAAYVAALSTGITARNSVGKAYRAVRLLREVPHKGEHENVEIIMMHDFLTDPDD